jgi:hypothetical protein
MENMLKCEFCNKAIGRQIFSCPHRPDSGCPFAYQAESASSGTKPGCMLGALLFIVVWLTLATVAFSSILVNAQVISAVVASLGALACFWGAGFLFLGFILYAIFGKNIVLYNPQSGVLGKYATMFGQIVGGGISIGWQPLPSEISQLSLSEPLRYPASISALAYSSQAAHYRELATYICQATLLAMVAQDVLELKHTQTHDTLLWVVNRQTERYFLTPKNGIRPSNVDGVLERKIIEVFINPEAMLQGETHLAGAPIEVNILIAAIFDKDHYQPQKWLIKLVEDDLISRGLGHRVKSKGITGWFKKNVEFDLAHKNALENEYRLMRQKCEQLELAQPGFTKKLRAEIEKAFSKRTESSD